MKTKLRINKDWYKEIMIQIDFLERKDYLTEEEKTEYQMLLDELDYIYRSNGYT